MRYLITIFTHKISTVGVQLASVVTSSNIDLGLVNEAGNLDIVGGLDELHALESTGGNETSTVPWFCTPCDFLTFSVTNGGVGLWRSPEAEVCMVLERANKLKDGETDRLYGSQTMFDT
jgi:hypothetical protein